MDKDFMFAKYRYYLSLSAYLLVFFHFSGSLTEQTQHFNEDFPVENEPVSWATCAGQLYHYHGLSGYGYLPSNATDRYGDTLGGIGSAVAFNKSSWRKNQAGRYEGILWAAPDRGWNTEGTLNYQSRIHKFSVLMDPVPDPSGNGSSRPNIRLNYLDTILLTGPDGVPITSLDPDAIGFIQLDGFPPLPRATYEGDGFGSPGVRNARIAMDCEGLVLDADGSFWISDEYGPYIYKFSEQGKMIHALQPPPAFLPLRNGTVSFSGAEPPMFQRDRVPIPLNPTAGRANNQGFEGLTASPDGKTIYAMMQSALNQEGGPKKRFRRQARLLEYDISGQNPALSHEHVVTLPLYDTGDKLEATSQSEIHQLSNGHFLVLARDSGFGRGEEETESKYRHVDIMSIDQATDIAGGEYDCINGSIASDKGVLDHNLTNATYCPFLDFNIESELRKFGLHNGGQQDDHLLNEKWESLSLVPIDQVDSNRNPEYFLFSFSDNDFKTQDGFQNFGQFRFSDKSGYNIDTQILVFRISYGQVRVARGHSEL